MHTLVIGGARSGKSTFAEEYAYHLGTHGIYIATSQIYDEEMQERVKEHKLQREGKRFEWNTIEEPFQLAERLQELSSRYERAEEPPIILVDCLTLWLTNWLLKHEHKEEWPMLLEVIDTTANLLEQLSIPIILVTNEVGHGIVPDTSLGRRFRDLSGKCNQRFAKVCDKVFLVTAGIPIELKSRAFSF